MYVCRHDIEMIDKVPRMINIIIIIIIINRHDNYVYRHDKVPQTYTILYSLAKNEILVWKQETDKNTR